MREKFPRMLTNTLKFLRAPNQFQGGKTEAPGSSIKEKSRPAPFLFFLFFFVRRRDFDTRVAWTSTVIVWPSVM